MKAEDLKVTLILHLITSCCIQSMKIHHGILHLVLDSRYDMVFILSLLVFLKDKSGVGIIVDYSRDYTVVIGV